MILPAAVHCAGGPVWCGLHGFTPIAPGHDLFVTDKALLRKRIIHRQHRFGRAHRNLTECGGGTRCTVTGSDDGKDRFTVKADLAGRKQRFISSTRWADIILARDVRGAEHIDDAGGGADRVKLNCAYRANGRIGAADSKMQRTGRKGDVIDINGFAGGVFERTVMGKRCSG